MPIFVFLLIYIAWGLLWILESMSEYGSSILEIYLYKHCCFPILLPSRNLITHMLDFHIIWLCLLPFLLWFPYLCPPEIHSGYFSKPFLSLLIIPSAVPDLLLHLSTEFLHIVIFSYRFSICLLLQFPVLCQYSEMCLLFLKYIKHTKIFLLLMKWKHVYDTVLNEKVGYKTLYVTHS